MQTNRTPPKIDGFYRERLAGWVGTGKARQLTSELEQLAESYFAYRDDVARLDKSRRDKAERVAIAAQGVQKASHRLLKLLHKHGPLLESAGLALKANYTLADLKRYAEPRNPARCVRDAVEAGEALWIFASQQHFLAKRLASRSRGRPTSFRTHLVVQVALIFHELRIPPGFGRKGTLAKVSAIAHALFGLDSDVDLDRDLSRHLRAAKKQLPVRN